MNIEPTALVEGMVPPAQSCLGQVTISFEQQIDGWCLYPDRPGERAMVDILVNGTFVRAAIAAQPRPDLRALGMGDGYCGFLLPLPVSVQETAQSVIEVRERRFGRLIGRIQIGDVKIDAALEDRLAVITDMQRAAMHQIDALSRNVPPSIGQQFGALGRNLVGLATRPGRRSLQHRHPGLSSAHDYVRTIARIDLGWSATPQVSVIVPSIPDTRELALLLREAACVLRPLGAEFILLDDGAQPLNVLLPTRLQHLRLIRAEPSMDRGDAFNTAALSARGSWLAVTDPIRLSLFGLADAAAMATGSTLYVDAAMIPQSIQTHPAVSIEAYDAARPRGGLCGLMTANAFRTMGGFRCGATEQTLWPEMVEKAIALGQMVVGWRGRRPFRAIRQKAWVEGGAHG